MRIATLNMQNLRLREGPDGPRIDGAYDRDVAVRTDRRLDEIDRRLAAELIARIDPDVLALQEVFDAATLDYFHDTFLARAGARAYPHRICLPGNDGHGLNVALMARPQPDGVCSHAAATADDLGLPDDEDLLHGGPIFRRDCLEVRFGSVDLFICHLKAPYPDTTRVRAIRMLEAAAIRRIVERRYTAPAKSLWMILGDFNTPATARLEDDPALAHLLDGIAVDLMQRRGKASDWTLRMPMTGQTLRPDAILASPALARLADGAVPQIEKCGVDPAAGRKAGDPFTDVGSPRPHASDHAGVWIDLPDRIFRSGP